MTGRTEEGFISQASLITYLKPYLRKNALFQRDEYSSFNRQFALLCNYFNAVRDTFPDDWANPTSILSKTAGINAFFRLLENLLFLIEKDGKQSKYEEFRARLEPLTDLQMDVETHKLYGTGGAIAFYELLKQRLGLQDEK
jgi:hypothetical protein